MENGLWAGFMNAHIAYYIPHTTILPEANYGV